MDAEMEAIEIVFAQRLASGESTLRRRALKHLQKYIKEESEKGIEFSASSLARLCKGLHYALWMQDKMLLQEELADEICGLLSLFHLESQMTAFARALITSLSKEWPNIDRWRMDKFLMLIRRLVRTLFGSLAERNWDPELSDQYLRLFRETFLTESSPICESLKYHCASIWLDELDAAASSDERALGKERSMQFIRPYIQLLREPISDTFFRSICSDIFDVILCDFEEKRFYALQQQKIVGNEDEDLNDTANEKTETNEKMDGAVSFLELDYKKIGEELLEVGKEQQVARGRRKRLCVLSEKYNTASEGGDPFLMPSFEGLKTKQARIEKTRKVKRGRIKRTRKVRKNNL